tara:strand:+ start:616 stop:852 length:237 start_codon:yes stop_codon:yes gene_type:complete
MPQDYFAQLTLLVMNVAERVCFPLVTIAKRDTKNVRTVMEMVEYIANNVRERVRFRLIVRHVITEMWIAAKIDVMRES